MNNMFKLKGKIVKKLMIATIAVPFMFSSLTACKKSGTDIPQESVTETAQETVSLIKTLSGDETQNETTLEIVSIGENVTTTEEIVPIEENLNFEELSASLNGIWYELSYLKNGHMYYSGYSPLPSGYPDYQDYEASLDINEGKANYQFIDNSKNKAGYTYSNMGLTYAKGSIDDKCENKEWFAILDTDDSDRELSVAIIDENNLFLLEKTPEKLIRRYYRRGEQAVAEAELNKAPKDALVLWAEENDKDMRSAKIMAVKDNLELSLEEGKLSITEEGQLVLDTSKQFFNCTLSKGEWVDIKLPVDTEEALCLRITSAEKDGNKKDYFEVVSKDGKSNVKAGERKYVTYSESQYYVTTMLNDMSEAGVDISNIKNVKTVGENPIVSSIYTADPAPMVVGDTLYLYTTHDEDELVNGFYTMLNWHCYSTKDMVNWTDHGQVFSLDDITWADDRAWAAQAVERNGKYYLYCPVHKKNGGMAIAVGVSDAPTGPFKDIGLTLVNEGDWNDIDPTVFIDDDGQAYLYFGNPELRYVLLNENMVSFDKNVGVVKIPMTEESFAKGGHETGTSYAEGPWFYKRNDIYYMVYAAFGEDGGNEHLAYSTSVSPVGPWTYAGVLMTTEGGTFTNHPGVIDFKGHSYLFYHTAELPGGSLFHRSVCVAEFEYNEDGTIDTIAKTKTIKAIDVMY